MSFIIGVFSLAIAGALVGVPVDLTNLSAISVGISSVEFAITLITDRFGPLFYLYMSPIVLGVVAIQGVIDSEYLRDLAKTIMEKIRTPPSIVFVLH